VKRRRTAQPMIMTWMGSSVLISELAPGYYLAAVCILCALVTIRPMRLA
jgi:MFS transporter, MHS family, proline/betaine transporter